MLAEDVLGGAFAVPRTSPSYPMGPYSYVDREYRTIAYRGDPEALRLPEARFQFFRMPDSTGFGEHAVAAQLIPVWLPGGEAGGSVHATYMNTHTANSGGRELRGFPQKLARPSLAVTQLGTLDFGPAPLARGSMGFRHRTVPGAEALAASGILLKTIPHADGRPRIRELVRFRLPDIALKGGWTGPAALELAPHALAPVADLPVREVPSATHLVAALTLELGEVVHDQLG
jgi:acetoacetate decarboxylase